MSRFLSDDIDKNINYNINDEKLLQKHTNSHKVIADKTEKTEDTSWNGYKLLIGFIVLVIVTALLVWVFFTYKPKEDQKKLQDATAGNKLTSSNVKNNQDSNTDEEERREMLLHQEMLRNRSNTYIPQPPPNQYTTSDQQSNNVSLSTIPQQTSNTFNVEESIVPNKDSDQSNTNNILELETKEESPHKSEFITMPGNTSDVDDYSISSGFRNRYNVE